jgi:lipopolysaccharide/colanic/teichoic acid biosynthesis glycosyltransferase
MDICGALIGLLFLSPVILVIGLLLRIETPGEVFYRQERIGRGGKRFFMLKFRTMRSCAEAQLEKILLSNPKRRSEYDVYQKLSNDPRQTRVGRFLRRSSLDELPQLWNVLRGEMSLVGPRPFLPEQLPLYGPAFSTYQAMLPGMTGLWQISGRSWLTFENRVQLDEKYLAEWSIWLDLKILALTPWAVLLQKGAY